MSREVGPRKNSAPRWTSVAACCFLAAMIPAATTASEAQSAGTVHVSLLRAAGQRPAFEVAAVKPANPGGAGSNFNLNPGSDRFAITNATLAGMLLFAYKAANEDQILGISGPLRSERFTVTAKLSGAQAEVARTMPPEQATDQLRLMLQSLLDERFGLKLAFRDEKRRALALEKAKGGTKLTEVPQALLPKNSDLGANPPSGGKDAVRYTSLHGGDGHLEAEAVSMQMLAGWISAQGEARGRMVVDRTGLPGKYDFHMDWEPEDAPQDTGVAKPAFETALREQLGLTLKPDEEAVPVVVVEHAAEPQAN